MAVYTEVGDTELEAFLAEYDIGEADSFKGVAEGVENSNYLLTTTRGQYFLTLYEKRVDPRDLPFFLGLMDHLAAHGITCPQADPRPRRQCAAHAWPASRPRSRPSCTACGRAASRCIIADRSARRWRRCISPAGILRSSGPMRCRSPAGGRCSTARAATSTASLARELAAELDFFESNWPQRSAGRRHPCRPVQRQRLLPARQAVGPDRLLLRLQRRLRLRRRDLPQRLVLRGRQVVQRHQGARAAAGLRQGAAARRRRARRLPLLARGAALRFLLTRLYDWVHTPADALVKRKDPAGISRQAALPSQRCVVADYGL